MQASGIRRRPDEKCDHGSRRTMLDKLVAAEEKRRVIVVFTMSQ